MPTRVDESIPASERDDVDLVRRVAAGDGVASRILVDRHLRSIVRFAYRMLGDMNEAEDVAQETFLRLWKNASRWEPRAKLSTWLFRVAHNLSVDRLRARRDVAVARLPEHVDPKAAVVELMERGERDLAVAQALESLPERQRTAISLVYYEGLSNREAADIMGVQVDALESLLSRGRRNLRKVLQAAQAEPSRRGRTEERTATP